MNENEVPAWCKVGQWVTESHPEHRLGVIDGIFSDGRVWVIWFHNADGFTGSNSLTKYLKPVKFRPYTFEEAKKLVGKVMEYNEDGLLPAVAIIGMVTRDSSKVYYNGATFDTLQDWDATIDGFPVGVPEVDEEALKGGQE